MGMTGVSSSARDPHGADSGYTTERLKTDDGVELALYGWLLPDPVAGSKPKAIVQISHGMAEHARRYDHLAKALMKAGYAVYAHDHRGHGQTARTPDELGYFADDNGWRHLVDDLYLVNRHIASRHPGVPIVMFAHSMGSFFAQDYLFSHGDTLAAAVLSGTNSGVATLVQVARGIALLERLRVGAHGRSELLQKLSFGDYNRRFKPTRTEFDWLSRDASEVDKYIADPLCGFALTVQGWLDVFGGLIRIEDAASQGRIPKDLPIHLFAGADDPVGRAGKGVLALVEAYGRAGLTKVTHQLYPSGRHEMLNEVNRDLVIAELIAWLDANVPHGR